MMKVEEIATEKLVPYARNAKLHSASQVSAIVGSIREFGFCNPVLIDKDNGIIAGHGRILAAQQMGLKKVPCIRLGHLTDNQRRAYILADNRLAEIGGGWDVEMAKLEIADIDWGELEHTSIDDYDWAGIEMMGADDDDDEDEDRSDVDAEPQVDKAEELREKWQVETGQLWQLGDHRILCGDSTKADDVARVMGGEKADAVLTDPPYGQNQKGVYGDEPEKHKKMMADVVSLLPITDGVVVAFQSPRTFHDWTDAARNSGFIFERMLWMYKAAQCTFPWRGWILTSESIPVCSIGKPNWQEIHPFSHDCYYLSEVSGELDKDSGWHGSVKPLTVISDLLSRISSKKQKIYEPFSGSGTTIIACEQLGRKCRSIEISPAYVAVAIQRWSDATGKKPTLVK